MHDLPIELLGSAVLRGRAQPVDVFDLGLKQLVQAMFRTMYRAQGQGLAAPQIGVLQRVVVIDMPNEDSPAYTLINPTIVETGGSKSKQEEGCLSIPGVRALVERYDDVVVESFDENGFPARIAASGDLAHCMQHEIDHLDGVLYVDRLSHLQRRLVLKRYEKLQLRKRA